MRIIAFLFVFLILPQMALAEADGPDYFLIKSADDVPLYANHTAASKRITYIPAGTENLENMGCEGGPDFSAWQAMSETEQAESKNDIWCKTSYDGHEGWVQNIYLAEAAPPPTKPTFDCGVSEQPHEIETLICGDMQLIALDHKMADIYAQALHVVESLDAGKEEAMNYLQASQRGWIKGRNECWKDLENQKGCAVDEYRRRMGYLQARWGLAEPSQVLRYACDESETEEFYASFYNGAAKPAVRIEYGDSVYALVSTPVASGTRYGGDFGRYIWIKGTEAEFVYNHEVPAKNCIARAIEPSSP